MKRKWLVRFEPEQKRVYTAVSDKGAEAFFASAEGLVRFLSDGGLQADDIRAAVRKIHSPETRNSAEVELDDGWA